MQSAYVYAITIARKFRNQRRFVIRGTPAILNQYFLMIFFQKNLASCSLLRFRLIFIFKNLKLKKNTLEDTNLKSHFLNKILFEIYMYTFD